MASTVVDTLVTKYVLDTEGYIVGSRAVTSASGALAKQIQRDIDATTKAASKAAQDQTKLAQRFDTALGKAARDVGTQVGSGIGRGVDLFAKGFAAITGAIVGSVVASMISAAKADPENNASLTNFMAAASAGVTSFGTALNDEFTPYLDDATKAVNKFIETGAFADVASSVADSIKQVVNAITGEKSVEDTMISLAAGFIVLSEGIRNAWLNIVDIVKFMASMVPFGMGDKMIAGLESYIEFKGNEIRAQMESNKLAQGAGLQEKPTNLAFERAMSDRVDAEVEAEKRLGDSTSTAIESNTRETARHTKRLADYTDSIFGGGDIGRQGISAVDVNSITGRAANGGSRNSGSRIERAAMVLGEIFDEGVMEGIMRARQAGLIN